MSSGAPEEGTSKKLPPAPRPRPAHSQEALAALQKLAKPQPRPADVSAEPKADPPGGSSSGSATGFVGMLAKGQMDAGDSRVGLSATDSAKRGRYSLEMARELSAAERPAGAAPAPQPRPKPRGWYHVALPLAWVLTVLLLVIGAWAVGALIYMATVTPAAAEDMRYPLLSWSENIGTAGGYTPGSRLMALAMVACLPVAVAAGAMGWMLRRRIARDR